MLRSLAPRRLDSHSSLLLALLLLAGCARRAPGGERLFVSDGGGAVVAIDMPTVGVVDRIAVRGTPRGLALSPDHATLYAALSAASDDDDGDHKQDDKREGAPGARIDGIATIDAASARLIRILPAGKDPVGVAVSRDGRTLFVTDQSAGAVARIAADGTGSPHISDACDTPEGIVLDGGGKVLFIACVDSDRVAMIDPDTMQVRRRIRVRGGPRALLAARDGRHIYVGTDNGRLIILTAAGTVERALDLAHDRDAARAAGMAETPDGHLFVTTGDYGAVIEVDPKAGTIVRTIDHVGAEPTGIGISGDGATLVTANGTSGDVSLINRASGKIVRKLNVGQRPWGVAGRGG